MDGPSGSHEGASRCGSTSDNAGNGATSGVGETEGGEEGEDSSSSSSSSQLRQQHGPGSNTSELDNFRLNWQRELETSPCRDRFTGSSSYRKQVLGGNSKERHEEERARDIYLQGVEAEARGHLYDAIRYYRRAVQLVPDIDVRIAEFLPSFKNALDVDSDAEDEVADEFEESNQSGSTRTQSKDLVLRFTKLCCNVGKMCQPMFEQNAAHISVLPSEVLLYICKWVVSSELDLKSLEQLSMVSRGFYLCARDSELWRLASLRVWGANSGPPNKYGSWREMFINRPRLKFNGAYISKTTYVRPGEPAFQDQTYRPWHIVDYFRYLRFFPEGKVLMLTTPEEPVVSLSKLRYRHSKHQAIISGHYRIHGNIVTAVLKRSKSGEIPNTIPRYRNVRQLHQPDQGEQTFHVELEVVAYKSRPNYKLEWRRYSTDIIYRNGQKVATEFDLSHTKFPPFWFSRVKSYTAVSEKPLQ